MDITGTFFGESANIGYDFTGAFYRTDIGSKPGINGSDYDNNQTGFEASRSWTGVTSGPRTYNSQTESYDNGHTHSLSGISTNNNTTDASKENRVQSMMMVPIIKY